MICFSKNYFDFVTRVDKKLDYIQHLSHRNEKTLLRVHYLRWQQLQIKMPFIYMEFSLSKLYSFVSRFYLSDFLTYFLTYL